MVGSQIDPESIANSHIRAHALEGRLFRTALAEALRAHRMPCRIIVEREAFSKAILVLSRTEAELKRVLSGLRLSGKKPWRADDKLAALAAWMVLAGD